MTHLLVSVSWFIYHPKNGDFGKPTTVWYYDIFESSGIYDLLPIQFIQGRSISLVDKLDGESVLFVLVCHDYHLFQTFITYCNHYYCHCN